MGEGNFGIEQENVSQPNCIGYAMHELGLVPDERFIDPSSPLFHSLLEQRLEKVEKIEDADAVAVTFNLGINSKGKEVIDYSHMAIVDKTTPGFVTEREGQGKPVRHVTLQEAVKSYNSNERYSPTLVFLRVKPQAASSS